MRGSTKIFLYDYLRLIDNGFLFIFGAVMCVIAPEKVMYLCCPTLLNSCAALSGKLNLDFARFR